MTKSERQRAEEKIHAEYGRKIRAANFAREEAVRLAIAERNEALTALTLGLPVPEREAS